MTQHRTRPAVLFLAGRDARHPGAAGGDLQAWEWARHLQRLGWRVVFVCQSGPDLDRAERIDGVDVRRLGRGLPLFIRAWRLHARKKHEWSLVYEDPIGGGRMPYFSPVYAKAPVIAVWHQVSAALLRAIQGPVVAAPFVLAERLVAVFYRHCLFWAPSVESADAVGRELRLPRHRIEVVPPTLGDDVEITPDQTGGDREPLFVCLGVMRPYKRFFDAISAMSKVRASEPSARLVVAGRISDPADLVLLRTHAAALGVSDWVDFRTNVTDAERQALLREARALVLPSLLEGFGIVTIEANAEGTPVIASTGVPVGAVTDGFNGLRFPIGDVEALTECMVRVAGDQQLWNVLATGAREQVRSLTVDAIAPRFDALVKRALAEA